MKNGFSSARGAVTVPNAPKTNQSAPLSFSKAYAQVVQQREALKASVLEAYRVEQADTFPIALSEAMPLVSRQDDFARLIGVSPTAVSRWVSGETSPPPIMRMGAVSTLKHMLLLSDSGSRVNDALIGRAVAQDLDVKICALLPANAIGAQEE
jgi:transcriptional regulator with XRE-family HTH domain